MEGLGRKESQFLRLKRTTLSVNDFATIKVIGKGAFGEVKNDHTQNVAEYTQLKIWFLDAGSISAKE
jgi:hypothetical protein